MTYVLLGLIIALAIAVLVAWIAIKSAAGLRKENFRLTVENKDLADSVARVQAAEIARQNKKAAVAQGTPDERVAASLGVLEGISGGKK